MSIKSNVIAFFPDYDTTKLDYMISLVKASVVIYCHLDKYPVEGYDTELDIWTAKKAMDLIRDELNGYVKSRSSEGYSETYIEAGLSEMDVMFLNSKISYF